MHRCITREAAKGCVGPGWAVLIDVFYDAFEKYRKKYPDISVNQVKEKFGGLRIYHSSPPNHDYGDLGELSWWLDVISFHFCEKCGALGKPRTDRFWIKTECDNCYRKNRDE